ncbi:uncharacterized protein At2g29880-like [Nymphaea colorata]|nr:uncharacterized protein At2g29880-like [Nymphaea colorata]
MEGSSSRNDSLVWSDAQLDHLIELLVEQSRLPSMKSGANLKPKAYKVIERQMIEMFGPNFKVEKIKNKLKSTKADYNECRQILSTSGFGWDPINQCVDVENEVWVEYIQKFPDRRKFKGGQKWKHYQQLDEVFGQSIANGIGSFTCSSLNRSNDLQTDEPPETPTTHNPNLGYNVHENVSFTQMLNEDSPVPSPTQVQQDSQQTGFESRTTNSSNKRARVSANHGGYETILQEIADTFRTMIDTSSYSCLNKCLELLQEMLELGEIDAGMHLKATMLMEKPNKPVVFLKLLPTQRVPWLLANVNHP